MAENLEIRAGVIPLILIFVMNVEIRCRAATLASPDFATNPSSDSRMKPSIRMLRFLNAKRFALRLATSRRPPLPDLLRNLRARARTAPIVASA
jgi:hypothetical protein